MDKESGNPACKTSESLDRTEQQDSNRAYTNECIRNTVIPSLIKKGEMGLASAYTKLIEGERGAVVKYLEAEKERKAKALDYGGLWV